MLQLGVKSSEFTPDDSLVTQKRFKDNATAAAALQFKAHSESSGTCNKNFLHRCYSHSKFQNKDSRYTYYGIVYDGNDCQCYAIKDNADLESKTNDPQPIKTITLSNKNDTVYNYMVVTMDKELSLLKDFTQDYGYYARDETTSYENVFEDENVNGTDCHKFVGYGANNVIINMGFDPELNTSSTSGIYFPHDFKSH
jgi:hypothetical protein